MGSRLPILTVAALVAAGLTIWAAIGQLGPRKAPGGTPAAPPKSTSSDDSSRVPDGQALLQSAILALEGHGSVSAKIRYSVDLFGHKPVGSGVYLEQRSAGGPLPQFRLSLRTQLGDRASSLLQVCDGRYLWRYRKLDDSEKLSRIDVTRVAEVLGESGGVDWLGGIEGWPGLGGLPKLLRGLHETFDFTSVGQTHLGGQLPVWKLQGQWKTEKLAETLPDQKEAIRDGKPIDLTELPRHLPDHVVLFLGKADGFPYRIEYRRRKPSREKGTDAPQDQSIVTMELFEVNLDVPIDRARFIYNPGDLEPSDETADFLKSLGLGR